MTYGGLRGAVSLAMALILDADVTVNKDLRDLVVFHTGTLFGDLSSAGMFY